MRAMKINPKMTEAATIIPTTTLGNPLLLDELDWLASVNPVFAVFGAVDVKVTMLGTGLGLVFTMGLGVVITCAVESGRVDVVRVVLVVR